MRLYQSKLLAQTIFKPTKQEEMVWTKRMDSRVFHTLWCSTATNLLLLSVGRQALNNRQFYSNTIKSSLSSSTLRLTFPRTCLRPQSLLSTSLCLAIVTISIITIPTVGCVQALWLWLLTSSTTLLGRETPWLTSFLNLQLSTTLTTATLSLRLSDPIYWISLDLTTFIKERL